MNMKKLLAIMLSVLLVLGSFNVIAYGEIVEATPAPAAETQAPEQQPTAVPSEPAPLSEEEDTAEPTEETTDEPTAEPTEEATDEPTAEPTEESTDEPTAEPTEEATDEPTAEPTEAPEHGIVLSLTANKLSVYAGEESIGLTADVAGGAEPYTMTLRANGEEIETKTGLTAGAYEFSHMPHEFGACKLEIVVTDAEGNAATAAAEVPVAVREIETEADWAKSVAGIALTGDWNTDLLAIALTQDGYVESQRDFIVDEHGRQGYTRYGDWFGRPYGEWCAMFVSFCLEYAGIPEEDYPRGNKCDELKSALQSRGAYEDDEHDYAPQPGDLIFFNWEEGNEPQHIGIVEEVTGTQVYTIEGNAEGRVQRKWYSIGDAAIVGYGNTRELMEIAIDKAEREAAAAEREQEKEANGESLIVDIPEIPYEGVIGRTNAANVNVRVNASTESDVLVKLAERKTQVTVLAAAADMEGVVWYAIQYGTATGFIRADLLNIELPEATPAPTAEPTAEPEATAEVEATEEATVEPEATAEPTVEVTAEPTAEATAEPTADLEIEMAGEQKEGGISEEELLQWQAETEVTERMLALAKEAKSLDSMVLDGDELIHVRTGKVYARYDAETSCLIDEETGMVVAVLDLEEGMVYPVKQTAAAAEAEADADDDAE